jgi:hypothetical protein
MYAHTDSNWVLTQLSSNCKGDRVGYDRVGLGRRKGTVKDVEELNTKLGIWQVESYRTKSRTTKKRRRRRHLTNARQSPLALLTNARHDAERVMTWNPDNTSLPSSEDLRAEVFRLRLGCRTRAGTRTRTRTRARTWSWTRFVRVAGVEFVDEIWAIVEVVGRLPRIYNYSLHALDIQALQSSITPSIIPKTNAQTLRGM